MLRFRLAKPMKFQSTPSARRATHKPMFFKALCENFNPRPPRGGRRYQPAFVVDSNLFQSTPSARRATSPPSTTPKSSANFNPRPPRGGRPDVNKCTTRSKKFQSTPSARRATSKFRNHSGNIFISIHALREEGDSKSGEKIHHVCSIIHTCAQFEKELYEGSGEMQNKSC